MILQYFTQKQILSNWCWAAVSASIANCFDDESEWIQNNIASAVLEVDCSSVSPPHHPISCNQLAELDTALTVTKNFRDRQESNLEFADIVNEIDHGCPIGCQIYWEVLDRSHFVCIFGYDDNTFELHIGDPESRVYIVSYEAFTNNYRGGKWIRTYLTQPES